ncbi:MAG TPA: DUF167 family protein [bacterium]
MVHVKVHPQAAREELVARGPGRFEAWVKAKPIEGRANEAVIALLARALRLPRSRLRLVRGAAGRHKLFRIAAS